ncbi:MAG: transcription repressor NadR [Bacillus sp. (in: firmicutes)]
MTNPRKLYGEDRRIELLKLLQESRLPLTGSQLSKMVNVSRQVIVGDITLLKAKGEPIMATSQGYVYLHTNRSPISVERVIACTHPPERTEEELLILVDLGVTVKDVKVEHPVYGDLTASIMVSNRREVTQFLDKIRKTGASLLSELTDGTHLHTISAPSETILNEAVEMLSQAGLLIKED